jgi:signal transduction histidine kinase
MRSATRLSELIVVLALVPLAVVEMRGYDGRTGPLAVHVAAVVVVGAALLVRHRWALPSVVAGAAAGLAQAAVGFAGSAAALVLYLWLTAFAATLPARRRVIGLSCLTVALLAIVLRDPDIRTLEQALPSLVLFGGAAAGGAALARRHAGADRVRREAAERHERVLEQERTRIARELHDVVTHSLSVVVVQAGAARLDAASAQAQALTLIEETARSALVEMRRLLGILRGQDGEALHPQPGLQQLPDLLAHVRASGVAVVHEVQGQPRELPPGLALTAYRVLQEALTNALTHADSRAVQVLLRWHPDRLVLTVRNDGAERPGTVGGAHGLVGMRERVELYDGALQAGPVAGGSAWEVEAVLPLLSSAAVPR